MPKTLIRNGLLIIVWLLLWRAAMVMEYAPHASVWFPPAALTLAAFLVMGVRAWPAITVVVLVSTWWIDQIYQAQIGSSQLIFAAGFFWFSHGVTYFLAAKLINRLVRTADPDTLPSTLFYILSIGVVATLLAALLGVGSLILLDQISVAEFFHVWWPWWTGDLIAVVVLTPMFIAVVAWRYESVAIVMSKLNLNFGNARWLPFLLKVGFLKVTLVVVILSLVQIFGQSGGAYLGFVAMLLLIPQLWIAFTERPFRIALSLGLLSICVAISAMIIDIRSVKIVLQLSVLTIALISWLAMLIPMLVASNQKLSLLANVDSVTGIASRRSFLERAEQCVELRTEEGERRQLEPQSLSLLMFDIDHFKKVNDSHGHALGDQALHLVATQVQRIIRQNDLLGRFGGDEFLLLLHGGSQQALDMADRIQDAVRCVARESLGLRLTLSFGVVELEPKESVMSALTRADALLFKAKRAGRAQAMAAS